MLRNTAQKLQLRSYFIRYPQTASFTMTSRNLTGDENPVHRAADKVGEKMPAKPEVGPFVNPALALVDRG